MRFVPSLGCVGILLAGTPASAQWSVLEGRVAVHIDAGYQAVSDEFQQTIVQRAYGEDARLAVTNTVGTGPFGDVGGFVLVREQLGVGATYSQITKSGTSILTGTVPHPILFGSDRSVTVEVGMLRHRAQATHIHVSWRIAVPAVEKLDLTVYGGPSIFNVAQGVVTGVVISEPSGPPFATVSIDQVTQDERATIGVDTSVRM